MLHTTWLHYKCNTENVQDVVNQAYQKLMVEAEAEEPAAAVPTQHFCWLLNESICDFTTNPANADQVIFLLPPPIWT